MKMRNETSAPPLWGTGISFKFLHKRNNYENFKFPGQADQNTRKTASWGYMQVRAVFFTCSPGLFLGPEINALRTWYTWLSSEPRVFWPQRGFSLFNKLNSMSDSEYLMVFFLSNLAKRTLPKARLKMFGWAETNLHPPKVLVYLDMWWWYHSKTHTQHSRPSQQP